MDEKDRANADTSTILSRIIEIDQRIARLESLGSTEVEKLSARVGQLENLGRLEREIEQKAQELRNEIKDEGARVKRTIIGSASLIASVLAVFGFFGLKYYAEESFQTIYRREIKGALDNIKTDAEGRLSTIKALQTDAVANFEALQRNRLIVLQTDYGGTGHLVGELKSLIYNSNPQARIDAITQNISKFSVREAAVVLWRAVKHFPDETIFLAITDSGERPSQPIAIRTENPVRYFVGLSNGMFDLVLDEVGEFQTVRISRAKVHAVLARLGRNTSVVDLDRQGSTEVIAAAAALLSVASPDKGIALEDMGEPTSYERGRQKVKSFRDPEFATRLNTTIIGVDGFGNATTSVTRDDLASIGYVPGAAYPQSFYVSLDDPTVSEELRCPAAEPGKGERHDRLEVVQDYSDVPIGAPLLLFSEEFLQLAINQDDFANKYCVTLWQRASICKKREDCGARAP